MPNYRRAWAPGGTFFFTVVSRRRRPVLVRPEVRAALRAAVVEVQRQRPFQIEAWVLLPDHMHCLWILPEDDGDYSARWSMIKARVTRRVDGGGRSGRREGSLWQRRFWEHQIRDEADLRRHVDYAYWNPVKHGVVERVVDWPYSTFHRDVRLGRYSADWGGITADAAVGEFGEPA